MSRLLVAVALALAVNRPIARGDDSKPGATLPDGIYVVHFEGQGTRVRRNDGGGEVVLGDRVGQSFGRATLTSTSNDNSVLRLELKGAGKLPKGTGPHLALVLDGICLVVYSRSDLRDDGTIDLDSQVYGEEAAKKVAAKLKIEIALRKHPGHRVEVRWTPEKDEFKVGEAITLKMELRNTGDVPFAFLAGGQQRGPRDNQFRFLAYRSYGQGKAVPDTGDPLNFGGLGGARTLKPGEVHTATVDISRWFQFTEADHYQITGIYELEIVNAEWRPLWDDLATGQCIVNVVASDPPKDQVSQLDKADYLRVEARGRLTAAIDAKTNAVTSAALAIGEQTWRVYLPSHEDLRATIRNLNGQKVVLVGELTVPQYLELRSTESVVRTNWELIGVSVLSLRPAGIAK